MAARLFTLGVVVFLLGVQFRRVDTYVLNPDASRFIEEKLPGGRSGSTYAALGTDSSFGGLTDYPPAKSYSPPKWLGFSLLSAGAVLMLAYPCFKK